MAHEIQRDDIVEVVEGSWLGRRGRVLDTNPTQVGSRPCVLVDFEHAPGGSLVVACTLAKVVPE